MAGKFDKYTTKAKKLGREQFESYAYNQGLNVMDEAMKSVVSDVKRKFSSGEITVVEAEDFSDGDIIDIAADSTTSNTLWLVDKFHGFTSDVWKFARGDMATSAFVESTVEKVSGFVAKAVKGVAIVTFGVMTLGTIEIPSEWIGAAASAITSKIFCAVFSPLVNYLRKKEAREEFERLYGFYEGAIAQLKQQRELFERATSELFEYRQALIDSCMKNLDAAFSDEDADRITESLSQIVSEFGGELKFKNFSEFDEFMQNSDEELIL